jgi:hypothetical protein
MKNIPTLAWIVIAAIGLYLAGGCSKQEGSWAGTWEYKEISRIKSPDSLVEAVIVEGDAGATTSTVTYIYLVPAGKAVDTATTEKSLFAADHLKNFKVEWKESKLLEIHYNEAEIFNFRNFWQSRDIQDFHYVVEAKLVPTSTDFSLPARDRNW